MNEERLRAYLKLIDVLLNCENGEEPQILDANRNLVDSALVEIMLQEAANLIKQDSLNSANHLMNIARHLLRIYEQSNSLADSNREAFQFLLEVLQVTQDSNHDSRVVYPFLQANLDKLDDNFAPTLQKWAMVTLPKVKPEQAQSIATVIGEFSILIRSFQSGDRARNLEIAIAGFESISTVFTRQAFPENWAALQSNWGTAYFHRVKGERAKNLELAIGYYLAALEERRYQTSAWAMLQNNLGNAYSNRIEGERAENLELAIGYYLAALEVHSCQVSPQYWADIQNNLGNTYLERIRGEERENLELAIGYYLAALEVRTLQDSLSDWAMTQNNLGIAYSKLTYKSAENVESAIRCHLAALKVRTYQSSPANWANTLNNLGAAYLKRIEGKRAMNVEAAICCHTAALRVYTCQTFPSDWANTQNDLGNAYYVRVDGNKTKNLEMAIHCYLGALEIRSRHAFPRSHAGIQFNLGCVYHDTQQFPDALAAFATSIDIAESLRGEIDIGSGREEDKRKLAEEHNRTYRRIVEVCLELARNESKYYNRSIEYIERSKARNLVELLANKSIYPKHDFYTNLNDYRTHCNQLDQLRREIPAKQREIEILTRNRESEEKYRNEIEQQQTALNQLRRQRNTLLQEINLIDSSFAFTQKVESIPFSDIQALIDEHTAIVEWYITDSQILAFIVTCHTSHPKVVPSSLEDLKALENWEKEYRDAYRQQKSQWISTLASRLQRLAEILHVDDILSSINKLFEEKGCKCDRLILVPHRYLHLSPLHALPLADGSLLLDRFPKGVGYTPSCQLLQLTQRNQHSDFQNLFAIQNPTDDLLYTNLEVEALRSLFFSSNVLKQQEATKEAINASQFLVSAHCSHFSCHGEFNLTFPLKSSLILANRERLSLGEIFQLSLSQCRLVTLSACETGMTDPSSISDEYIGLPSAFLYAGSSSVVSSLWTVNDLATTFLMIKFYENLHQYPCLEPGAAGIALNHAQTWLRDLTTEDFEQYLERLKPQIENSLAKLRIGQRKLFCESLKQIRQRYPRPFAHPYYWAAFTAVGC